VADHKSDALPVALPRHLGLRSRLVIYDYTHQLQSLFVQVIALILTNKVSQQAIIINKTTTQMLLRNNECDQIQSYHCRDIRWSLAIIIQIQTSSSSHLAAPKYLEVG